jgi:phosphoribosylformimino-5-aminoimidazole carboxamide ribotide isomerase
LKVIPVIDILNGIVVHAVRGRRKEYQPLKSVLCASANPLDVATAFKALGFDELYVADLDAITGKHTNFSILKQIADRTGLELTVDAGITDLEKAEKVRRSHVSNIVIGTETLTNINFVKEAIKFLGREKVVVSLDLIDGKVTGRFELGKFRDPVALSREFQEMGVAKIIMLDLARVGSGEGVNLPILKKVMRKLGTNVIVGGGVRDVKDLLELQDIGVFGALLATALHSGRIPLEELRHAGLL